MKPMMNRREMLWATTAMAGTLAGSAIWKRASASTAKNPADASDKWAYHKLAPAVTAEMGYDGYYKGHCCYGVFYSIVGQMAEQHGAPYDGFPFWMMEFGTGGIGLYGSVCGALNGAAAAIGLFHHGPDQNSLITDLFAWYEQANLPLYQPAKPVLESTLHQSISHSVLCHRSVGKWCNSVTPVVPVKSKPRAERCARLAADVSRKTVELLNAKATGQWKPVGLEQATASCMACHGLGESDNDTIVRMECGACHNDMAADHGKS